MGGRGASRYGNKRANANIIAADKTMPGDTIAIASDHAGFELKSMLREELAELGFAVLDLGTNDMQSVDYPDFAYAMTAAVRESRVTRGVLVCGSGIGISMAANRAPEIRAALIYDVYGARMARRHNDASRLGYVDFDNAQFIPGELPVIQPLGFLAPGDGLGFALGEKCS